ncbi:hypothetical protein GOV04_03195 [Candidatus Woesearchaeota archaeon]|nr:hypothetical protein [Candidatus Woesearchaeota archaeon]
MQQENIEITSDNEFLQLQSNLSKLLKKYNLTPNQVLAIKPLQIPISIFSNNQSPLESVCLHLFTAHNLNLKTIGKLLNRDQRTIWLTLHNAKKKLSKPLKQSKYSIPIYLLSNRKYSILETVVAFLKENKSLTLTQIGVVLNKNPKTVWTVYNRYKQKEVKK